MEEGELHVDFDSREVTYGLGELDELVLAYLGAKAAELLKGGGRRAFWSPQFRSAMIARSCFVERSERGEMSLAGTRLEVLERGQRRPLLFPHAGEVLAPERPWLELLSHRF